MKCSLVLEIINKIRKSKLYLVVNKSYDCKYNHVFVKLDGYSTILTRYGKYLYEKFMEDIERSKNLGYNKLLYDQRNKDETI